jgi:hypothetical protein
MSGTVPRLHHASSWRDLNLNTGTALPVPVYTHTHTHTYIYIYIYTRARAHTRIYRCAFILKQATLSTKLIKMVVSCVCVRVHVRIVLRC